MSSNRHSILTEKEKFMQRRFASDEPSLEYNKKLLKIIAEKRYKNTYYLNFKEIRDQMIVSYVSNVETLSEFEREEVIDQLKRAGEAIERNRLEKIFEDLNLSQADKKIVVEYLEIHQYQIGDFLSDKDFRNRIVQKALNAGQMTDEEYILSYLSENHNRAMLSTTSAIKEYLTASLNNTLNLLNRPTNSMTQAAC